MIGSQREYDQSGADIFSPDGRVFQVEYAREAVKRGTTSVGVVCHNGVVLIADKRLANRLIIPSSVEKMFVIDKHMGCSVSGLIADARVLVDIARDYAQYHRMSYDEPVDVGSLVRYVSDCKQYFTQNNGHRPFGTALLIAGRDTTGYHLYETDPSGSLVEYLAGGIGSEYQHVQEFFEKEYKPGLDVQQGLELGMRAMMSGEKPDLDSSAVEAGRVDEEGRFRFYERAEIEAVVAKIRGRA